MFPSFCIEEIAAIKQKSGDSKQKKIKVEINVLIFDTKLSFNAYPDAFVKRRGVCLILLSRLCQGRALVFKSSFTLVWKSICHMKSNYAVLCTSGFANSTVSFHMEMLLAFTLPSSGVGSVVENVAGGAASTYLPPMFAELHYFALLNI